MLVVSPMWTLKRRCIKGIKVQWRHLVERQRQIHWLINTAWWLSSHPALLHQVCVFDSDILDSELHQQDGLAWFWQHDQFWQEWCLCNLPGELELPPQVNPHRPLTARWEESCSFSLARGDDVPSGSCEPDGTSCWSGRSAISLQPAWLCHLLSTRLCHHL